MNAKYYVKNLLDGSISNHRSFKEAEIKANKIDDRYGMVCTRIGKQLRRGVRVVHRNLSIH